MADDIVTQLQQLSASLGRGEGRSTVLGAAAEIERLRDELAAWQATVRAHDALAAERADEIERLRAAGDAMATNYELLLDQNWSAFAASFLHEWQEARRG